MLNIESVVGGKACMEALLKLEEAADESMTAEDYFLHRESAISDFMLQAGHDLPPMVAGFIRTLVEYAFTTMESGEPDFRGWVPESAMTEEELASCRREVAQ